MTLIPANTLDISSVPWFFIVGAVAGAIATAGFRKLAVQIHFSAPLNPITPQHQDPVAYLGGLGIAAPLLLYVLWSSFAVWPAVETQLILIALASSTFLLIGLLDDAIHFNPKRKILLQFLAACMACTLISAAPLTGIVPVDFLLSVLWIITVVNAVNFTDVSDGLVGGLSAIALFAFAILIPGLGTFLLMAAGACLGFLWFNRPPARIFLGDAGSHLLGSLLALLGILSMQNEPKMSSLLSIILILGIFLFEFAFITWARIRNGLPWWRGSPDHFALRMQAAGHSRDRLNMIAWLAASLLAWTGIWLTASSSAMRWFLLSASVILGALAWRKLISMEAPTPDTRGSSEPHVNRADSCGLCEASGVSRVIDTGAARVGICLRCGTGRVLGLNSSAQGPEFVESYAEAYNTDKRSNKALLCMHLFASHGPVAPHANRELLEIGCGQGEFLDLAREVGWNTTGVEISRRSASAARQSGHQISTSSVLQFLPGRPSHFGVVVMWDLLEHLEFPRAALANCARWLEPGGTLILLTPHMGSFYDRLGLFVHSVGFARRNPLLRMCWSQAHLYRFSPTGLRDELLKLGFSDILVEPKLLLSLDPDKYAGGKLMPSWTRISVLNRLASRFGVALASKFRLHNKVIVTARKLP